MGLRYSDIIISFYMIEMSQGHKDMVDTHFTGAAHHIKRFHESIVENDRIFHLHRHRLHLRLMLYLVRAFGDFTSAKDPTGRGLEHKQSWDHDQIIMPDPLMFRKMEPDSRCPVGAVHPSDNYLHDKDWLNYLISVESRRVS